MRRIPTNLMLSPESARFQTAAKLEFVKNRSYDSLVDTGADVSCISKALAEVLIDQKLVVLQPSSLPPHQSCRWHACQHCRNS